MLILGFGFLIASVVLKTTQKTNAAVFILFIAAIILYCYAAMLDPFLNLWDERFHALVAKNLLQHPLMPTLYPYPPTLSAGYDRWDRAAIWLHKQPFFLWQISLSYYLFGISEFTTRLPSVIMAGFLVPLTYRTGKLLVGEDTGYYGAYLISTSYYLTELVAGKAQTDHNDVAFLFYVSASVWAWTEYLFSKKKRWIILIGLFSGIAVMIKWLTGLVVYFGWMMYLVKSPRQGPGTPSGSRHPVRVIAPLIKSIIVSLIIVLPWQILSLLWYPAEAIHEFRLNSNHFHTAVEGHSEYLLYHFYQIRTLYGFAFYLIFPVAIIVFYSRMKNKILAISFLSIPIVVYLFFSMAQTRMPAFTYMVCMCMMILAGTFFDWAFKWIKRLPAKEIIHQILVVISLLVIGFLNDQPMQLLRNHSETGAESECRNVCISNKKIFEELKNDVPPNSMVFNLKGRTYVDCMFYSGLTSYNFVPTAEQYNSLKSRNIPIVLFLNDQTVLPDYLAKDHKKIVITKHIGSCEE